MDPEALNEYSSQDEAQRSDTEYDQVAPMGRSSLRTAAFELDDAKYGGKKAKRSEVVSESEDDSDDGVGDAIFNQDLDMEFSSGSDDEVDSDGSDVNSGDEQSGSDDSEASDRFQRQLKQLAAEDGYVNALYSLIYFCAVNWFKICNSRR